MGRLVRDLVNDEADVIANAFPELWGVCVSEAEDGDEVCGCVIDAAHVVEEVVGQLVDIYQSSQVVKEHIKVLWATVEACWCDRVNCLNHALESGAHLIKEFEFILANKERDAVVEIGDIANTDTWVRRHRTNWGVEEAPSDVSDLGKKTKLSILSQKELNRVFSLNGRFKCWVNHGVKVEDEIAQAADEEIDVWVFSSCVGVDNILVDRVEVEDIADEVL